MLKNSRWIFI